MSDGLHEFRDFGILPDNLPEPAANIRCFISPGRIIGQYVSTAIVVLLGLAWMTAIVMILSLPLSAIGCAATAVAFGAWIYLVTRHDYRWIELEGDRLHAQHLYTGCMIDRAVSEIECLETIMIRSKQVEARVVAKLFGRVKGVDVYFNDRHTCLCVRRADPAMTNAEELIQAILYRMQEIGDLECETINVGGQPVVKNTHWKGKLVQSQKKKNCEVLLACLMGLCVVFGPVLGYMGLQEQNRHAVATLPPHELSLQSLIESGPGSNRHVTIADFRHGGYAAESRWGSWTNVWVALFPADLPQNKAQEIKVVLLSKHIADEAALVRLLQLGRITCICSPAPKTRWGATLGPTISESNRGATLSSAWVVEYLDQPPSETFAKSVLVGSIGCFVAAFIIFAVIVYRNVG
jgi:hypothetical protein